ncbi:MULTISPECIES: protein-glutamate O-methyltransferase CheR [unclassified Paenibacillus]|uniref:CheR family methyltransferase n=1 Tax=unclassified Paenibacillus TaxID=185978 RepID=UPI00240765E6|nr:MULTISPECIES: protein-glutamate O-methyltransferase CheR [unclassified Paenibacillus]MDF9839512.1 chemotaxis protein methyltransferase CheR [Paenibacillus sp. PastF-2]MDF9846093.1 chemotaxis protein methyltransferase CheR [Paenibacillus sp. PastM-2]MDF9852666.1 chemotaxis protein methyltransferase CheR [Paenibacillus sp. PastF-1]MDH6477603.1 chemotaxis protein methyltransferase CheR [Paenibacillus sp. PastH-2]MDH6505346.1 chemotaxis protein methyltransferase CheR [Paenibacillus sp. PastM-3]
MSVNELKADEAPLRRIAEIIYDHSGLNYRNNLYSLQTKIAKRLQELNLTVLQYAEHVQRDAREIELLMQCVTINETYFFREEAQLKELAGIVSAQGQGGVMRIWSAACSSGEEPYSIGMVLAREGIAGRGNLQIIASDINQRVLSMAEKGLYPKQSLCFRRTTGEQLDEFFDDEGNGYRVKAEIRSLVEFNHTNLLHPFHKDRMGTMDAIFCRNVLIYFDPDTVSGIIERFYMMLKPGGYLFLGHAETIRRQEFGFDTVKAKETFYFRKRTEAL